MSDANQGDLRPVARWHFARDLVSTVTLLRDAIEPLARNCKAQNTSDLSTPQWGAQSSFDDDLPFGSPFDDQFRPDRQPRDIPSDAVKVSEDDQRRIFQAVEDLESMMLDDRLPKQWLSESQVEDLADQGVLSRPSVKDVLRQDAFVSVVQAIRESIRDLYLHKNDGNYYSKAFGLWSDHVKRAAEIVCSYEEEDPEVQAELIRQSRAEVKRSRQVPPASKEACAITGLPGAVPVDTTTSTVEPAPINPTTASDLKEANAIAPMNPVRLVVAAAIARLLAKVDPVLTKAEALATALFHCPQSVHEGRPGIDADRVVNAAKELDHDLTPELLDELRCDDNTEGNLWNPLHAIRDMLHTLLAAETRGRSRLCEWIGKQGSDGTFANRNRFCALVASLKDGMYALSSAPNVARALLANARGDALATIPEQQAVPEVATVHATSQESQPPANCAGPAVPAITRAESPSFVETQPVPESPTQVSPAAREASGFAITPKTLVGVRLAGEKILTKEYKRLCEIKKEVDRGDTYTGQSPAILRVFESIRTFNCAQLLDKPVLLRGPTGVGKTAIAKLIHDSSSRQEKSWCRMQAAFLKSGDPGITHATLTGHGEDSGLPNLDKSTDGILHQCDHGTLFIDEVADLDSHMQDMLLDILDKTPLSAASGVKEQVVFDVRCIFATNANLEVRVKKGHFRQDLFERIRALTIEIPPLVDRPEDIPLFVEKLRGETRVDPSFLLALLRHNWPGNVRELMDVIAQAQAKAISKKSELRAEFLALPCAIEVSHMATRDVEGEVYRFLYEVLAQQGFEKNKGLHKRMAHILDVKESKITAMSQIGQ